MLAHRLLPATFALLLLALPTVALAQPGHVPTGPARSSAPADDKLVTITLRDGQLLRGQILAETSQHIILRLVSGGEMAIAQSDIRKMKRNDKSVYVSGSKEVYKHDPNRTRYLYGPSAFMLREGEGYFSQTELFASTLGYGVTDWLSIQVGSVLPALLAEEPNFILGARVGTKLADVLHVSAGFNSFMLPGKGGVGLALGTATLGSPKAHVSVSAGYPFAFDSGDRSDLGPVVMSISGNLRVSKHVALITENWMLPDDQNSGVITSFAGRFMGEHSAVDVGFVFLEGAEVPLPWLDFTWNWD